MARAKATPKADLEEARAASPAAPKEPAQGPTIEYFGEGAEAIKFTVNPKARHYAVYASGTVIENL